MMSQSEIYDFIYFDEAKVWSLLSQLEEGISREMRMLQGSRSQLAGKVSSSIAVVSSNLDSNLDENESVEFSVSYHHDLLHRLLTHINSGLSRITIDNYKDLLDLNSRDRLAMQSFIQIRGKACIEEVGNLGLLAENQNLFVGFLNKTILRTHPQIGTLFQEIESTEKALPHLTGNKKRDSQRYLDALRDLIDGVEIVSVVDKGYVSGLKEIVPIMYKDKVRVRIFPDIKNSDVHTISSLMEGSLLEPLNQVLFNYGVSTNVDLELFGIITSIPQEGSDVDHRYFDPDDIAIPADSKQIIPKKVDELDGNQENADAENEVNRVLENLEQIVKETRNESSEETPEEARKKVIDFDLKARKVFKAMENAGEFFRGGVYPRLIVSPIALYRKIVL